MNNNNDMRWGVKSSEYYKQASNLLKRFRAEVNFHIKMGTLYKNLYKAADKYGDKYKFIKKWALKKNEKHYQLGVILNEQSLNLCASGIVDLTKLIEKEDT